MDLSTLKYLLNRNNLKPRKAASQNFLVNQKVIEDMVMAADVSKKDTVLEIGPGLGAVTTELVKKAGQVIAVESDNRLLTILQKIAYFNANLKIINQDIFKVNLQELGLEDGNYKIVASLPYHITSLIFRNFLEKGPRPSLISVIIQKEVAKRIIALPGQMSLLALSIQLFGKPQIRQIVNRDNFYPAPAVDSAILTVENIKEPNKIKDFKLFFRFLHMAFAAKRKTLVNNLQNGLKIEKKDINNILINIKLSTSIRAQEIPLAKWPRIFDRFYKFMI